MGQAETKASRVQDLATAMAVVEFLKNYKRGDSSKVECSEDSHAKGRRDKGAGRP